ncbi:MAG: DUF58 domain-containing protein [Halanaerobiales bacterium]|nr:DUF58 domain-containing protein [Halanaerobiales bacterium]
MFKKDRLSLLLLLLVIAIFKQNLLLVFGVMLVIAIIFIIGIWNRFCFAKLKIQRRLTKENIFVGEQSQYVVEVENRKLLPLLMLQINDNVTRGVNFSKPEMLASQPGSPYNIFSDVYSLKWYEKVTRKYTVIPERRGYFTFGKGSLSATDLFGLFTQTLETKDRVFLLVYPRILPIEKFGLPIENPFGRQQMNQWIFEDPANQVGIRPYQQGDKFSQINWKATARHQNFQVNVIKPTMDVKLNIILNTRLMNQLWEGYSQNVFEVAVMCAASVADYGLRKHYQVGLLTNGIIYERADFVKILPGKLSTQREKILRALAMIEPYHHKDIDQMIYREFVQKNFEVGTTVVFITAIMNQKLVDAMRVLKVRGFSPTIIKLGEMEENFFEQLTGMPVYLVNEERLWNEIKGIEFVRKSVG